MAVVICPHCAAKNRVENRGVHIQPVCGRCGAKLPLSASSADADGGKPIEISDANFSELVLATKDVPFLLDCWANWCPPCRALSPIIDELAQESAGRYRTGKLDVDQNQRVAAQFKIEAVPTLLIFKNGRLVDRIQGLARKNVIQSRLATQAV